jgi:hypothetical protein
MSCRHWKRRARAKALKADCAILLDRFQAWVDGARIGDTELLAEIAEMRLRLAPPPGVTAPIVRTGYTRRKA